MASDSVRPAPDLLNLLEDALHPGISIRFDPAGLTVDGSDLARRAMRCGRALRTLVGPGDSISMMLTSEPDAIATLLGAWRHGLRVASMPLPGRAQSAESYAHEMDAILKLAGARLVVVDAPLVELVRSFTAIEVESYDRLAARDAPVVEEMPGDFVQFTSGTTGAPRGVMLGLDAIAANVDAIIAAVDPRPGDHAVSWLPLSHDMGLIGMALTSIVAGGPRWAGSGRLVLIQPEQFLARPSVWLETCAEVGATITAGPTFGYALATRAAGRLPHGCLTSLRTAIVGAEPILAKSLRDLERALAPTGFGETALCPAYGMAEASLSVSMKPAGTRWQSHFVDAAALWSGAWTATDADLELVSSGRPLAGMHVTTETEVGELLVDGPSMYSGYLGQGEVNGPHHSQDLGAIIDGEVVVVGRLDDVIVARGRQLAAPQLEYAASTVPGVRPGSCVAVADPEGGFVIVAEPTLTNLADLAALGAAIRTSVVAHCGVAPSRTLIVERGSVPKTASGKPQRHLTAAALAAGSLATLPT